MSADPFGARVPSRERMIEFAVLLKRHAGAVEAVHEFEVATDRWEREDGPPPVTVRGCHPIKVMTDMEVDIYTSASHADFIQPYGWPNEVRAILNVMRTPESVYGRHKFTDPADGAFDVDGAWRRVMEIKERADALARLVADVLDDREAHDRRQCDDDRTTTAGKRRVGRPPDPEALRVGKEWESRRQAAEGGRIDRYKLAEDLKMNKTEVDAAINRYRGYKDR